MEQHALPVEGDAVTPGGLVSADGFSRWIAPHWAVMARLAERLSDGSDWEDVLQEALTAAWRRRDRYDARRGSARNWLLAITAEQARASRRRSSRHAVQQVTDDPAATLTRPRDVDVERALRRLTDRQRLTVELYYFLDLPVADIAAVMARAEGTVKSTLADARARLRAELGEGFA